MPGPAPQLDALRRNRPSDQAGWVHLPAAGRTEPAPPWPLTRPNKRELILWIEEWRRPQALMWEQLGLAREVGLYVRQFAYAESWKGESKDRSLVRAFMLGLGLTAEGLARRRWTIDPGEPAAAPVRNDDPDRQSAKARLKAAAIEGGAA